ncbi:MAG: hypothetical protein GF309_14345 [Candidatus Lokiarchaeota archaeon]|nr:hypothetical protein [Candidatus Lokiarchaeota archaeon]
MRMNILDRLLEMFSINKTLGSHPSESMNLLKHVRAVRARAFQKITGKKLRSIDSLDSEEKLSKSGRLSLLRRLRR